MTTLRELHSRGGLKVGHYVGEFVTPGIGHILAGAGCEYVFLDMEHSGFSYETIGRAVRFLEAADIPAMVRVPGNSRQMICRALDVGAEGIVLPMLGSADEARAALDVIKYTPRGGRGVALGIAHDKYRTGAVNEALAAANNKTVLVPLIESRAGVDNIDSIAAVEGVDLLWIGHFDLSCDLGIPGQFDHPDFVAAISAVMKAGQKHNTPIGRMTMDPMDAARLVGEGCEFIAMNGDLWLLQSALKQQIDTLKANIG